MTTSLLTRPGLAGVGGLPAAPPRRHPARPLRRRAEPGSLLARAHACAQSLPEGVAFSHTTAARLLGLPLRVPWSPGEPLHAVHPTAQITRAGVVGHRARRPAVPADGVLVTTPVSTWRDLALSLPLEDLVVLADAVLGADPGSRRALARAAAAGRGSRRAKDALALARVGAGSALETTCRLAVVRAGLPEPRLGTPVTDVQGRFVVRAALLWEDAGVVVDAARGGEPEEASRTRIRTLEAAGYRALPVTPADLAGPGASAPFLSHLAGLLGVAA